MRATSLLASVVAVLTALGWTARTADACTIPQNTAFELDAAHADDHVAPGPVTIDYAHISSIEDYEGCNAQERTSCSGVGTFSFSGTATDDRTPVGRVGFVVSVVEGELPALSRGAPFSPVRGEGAPHMDVVYVFGNDDRAYDFVLEVRAIDLNGNVGPPTLVPFSRGTASGCATGRPHGTLALVGLVLLVSLRRRRHS